MTKQIWLKGKAVNRHEYVYINIHQVVKAFEESSGNVKLYLADGQTSYTTSWACKKETTSCITKKPKP